MERSSLAAPSSGSALGFLCVSAASDRTSNSNELSVGKSIDAHQLVEKRVMPSIMSEPTNSFIGQPIELVSLNKSYGRVQAVRDISLSIKAGEFVSLLGPSGSGKTTTLMMIAGFEIPTSGEINLGGSPIATLPAHLRNLGVVFQSYALFPHLTVFENVAFPLKMRGISGSDIGQAVARALLQVKMGSFGDRLPHQLSGGQQQRIALARALVFRPGVVLMDEPLGALDKQLREHMQFEIKQLHRELGLTVIYVTHDQSEALALSDRIVVMNDSRIEQVGTAEEVYERPATRFVASFVGESNFLEGEVFDVSSTESDQFEAKLRVSGGEIEVRSSWRPSLGKASALVRPEKITVAPMNDDQFRSALVTKNVLNCLQGTVEDIAYFGSYRKYRLRLDDPSSPAPISALMTTRSGTPQFAVSERVNLIWAASDTRLMAPSCADSPLQASELQPDVARTAQADNELVATYSNRKGNGNV